MPASTSLIVESGDGHCGFINKYRTDDNTNATMPIMIDAITGVALLYFIKKA